MECTTETSPLAYRDPLICKRREPGPNSTKGTPKLLFDSTAANAASTSKPCNAQECTQPREQSLQGFQYSKPCQYKSLLDAKIHPRLKRSLANVVVFSQLKQGWTPARVRAPSWAMLGQCSSGTPGSRLPIPSLSSPCPNGLGAQAGPQGAAIAWGVLPCQGRGYGSGSLRHLERNGDICSQPGWATRSPEPSQTIFQLCLKADLQLISH